MLLSDCNMAASVATISRELTIKVEVQGPKSILTGSKKVAVPTNPDKQSTYQMKT